MKSRKVYIGIDQTWAVDAKGKPKPLPACLIQDQTVELFYLSALDLTEIQKRTQAPALAHLICLDCVLGLPMELGLPWDQALKSLTDFPGYGRKPAQEFFFKLGKGQIPRRQVEVRFKANSVFQEKPFQKNIQTGTFRLWKELQINRSHFFAPAIEERTSKNQVPLYEGYPSLSWKVILGAHKRDPRLMSSLLKKLDLDLKWTKQNQIQVEKDPNLADAFVLALTMKICERQAKKIKPHPEGFILIDETLL